MRYAVLATLFVISGCVTDDPSEDEGDLDLEEVDQAGISLNGISLNGISLNGISLNGVSVAGKALKAGSTTGAPLSGTAAIGSKWTASTATGSVVLRIDSAQQLTGANADLWSYALSYQNGTTWTRVCDAVTVAGVWSATAAYSASTTQFTFACRGSTVAKCVELGYKPYRGYANQLASCTRLLRGDYCGNGVAYTADGTTLNLYDNVGVQRDTQALWLKEGEWGPNGARCVTNLVTTRFLERKLTLPSCVLSLVSLTCGSFRSGTYLIDELPLLQL